MARGTTLANVLLMLKGELGASLQSGVSTAIDTELYTLIQNKQTWLSQEYDWNFLDVRADINIAAGTGNDVRYQTTPTTINFDRPVSVSTLWTNFWHPVDYGIGLDEYNSLPSGDGGVTVQQMDPIMRWRFNSQTQFEIWPLPASAQVIRFEGQRPLTTLKSGADFNPAATLDLDDLLVALYAAAQKLAFMKAPQAQFVLAQAEKRLNRLRADFPDRYPTIQLGRPPSDLPRRRVVPIITVA